MPIWFFFNFILWFEFSNFIKICACWMPKFFETLLVDYTICLTSQYNSLNSLKLGKTWEFDDNSLVQSIHKCYLTTSLMCHILCYEWKAAPTPCKCPRSHNNAMCWSVTTAHEQYVLWGGGCSFWGCDRIKYGCHPEFIFWIFSYKCNRLKRWVFGLGD